MVLLYRKKIQDLDRKSLYDWKTGYFGRNFAPTGRCQSYRAVHIAGRPQLIQCVLCCLITNKAGTVPVYIIKRQRQEARKKKNFLKTHRRDVGASGASGETAWN
jgi:hypothetical protein